MSLFNSKHKPKKIAFCLGHGCGIGNFVQSLPAVRSLFEQGHIIDLFISAFAYGDIAEIIKGQSYVRHIYENTYNNKEEMYDICIVSFLSDYRVDNARKYIKLKKSWGKTSEYGQYCLVAKKLGANQFGPPEINISDKDFRLKHFNVLFHAGCSPKKMWERKKWTHYMELIDLLIKDGIYIYCCGKEDEAISHPDVASFVDLPIQETIALINQCDLFVSNDSGLMHIAAALRKRQIAIFTATSKEKSAPYYNSKCHVISPKIGCYPCQDKELWNECTNWKCRDAISAASVYGLIKKVANSNNQ